MSSAKRISFQGWPGANSDMASRQVFPDAETVPWPISA
jgi:prephenate dehydratase